MPSERSRHSLLSLGTLLAIDPLGFEALLFSSFIRSTLPLLLIIPFHFLVPYAVPFLQSVFSSSSSSLPPSTSLFLFHLSHQPSLPRALSIYLSASTIIRRP